MVAQNHPPSVQPQPTRASTEVLTVPVSATLAPRVVHVVPAAPPSVNMVLFVNDDVCRHFPPPSENLGLYDKMDDFQEQFDKMQREMKALRGKSYSGKV